MEKRLAAYKTHNPDAQLFTSFTFSSIQEARHIENIIKRQFRAQQAGDGKEWFSVPPEQIANAVNALNVDDTLAVASNPLLHRSRVPIEVQDWLYEITKLIDAKSLTSSERAKKQVLKEKCKKAFSLYFGLGLTELQLDDRKFAIKNYPAVDLLALHKKGKQLSPNAQKTLKGHPLNFPGSSHHCNFWRLHKLSSGHSIAYAHTVISMPYCDHWSEADRESFESQSAEFAADVGWSFSDHNDWSWHFPGRTALHVFQMSTPSTEIERLFSKSFRKFIIENEKQLKNEAGSDTDMKTVIEDIVEDKSFPLDIEDIDSLYNKYLTPVWSFRRTKEEFGSYYGEHKLLKLIEVWQGTKH